MVHLHRRMEIPKTQVPVAIFASYSMGNRYLIGVTTHYDTQHYDTHHNDIQHDGSVVMLSVVILSTIMLNVTYKPFTLSVVTPIDPISFRTAQGAKASVTFLPTTLWLYEHHIYQL